MVIMPQACPGKLSTAAGAPFEQRRPEGRQARAWTVWRAGTRRRSGGPVVVQGGLVLGGLEAFLSSERAPLAVSGGGEGSFTGEACFSGKSTPGTLAPSLASLQCPALYRATRFRVARYSATRLTVPLSSAILTAGTMGTRAAFPFPRPTGGGGNRGYSRRSALFHDSWIRRALPGLAMLAISTVTGYGGVCRCFWGGRSRDLGENLEPGRDFPGPGGPGSPPVRFRIGLPSCCLLV
jgi:hypothetical protein